MEYNAANLAFSPSSIALNAQNQFGIHEYTQILLIGNYSLKESAIGLSYQAENGIITNQKIAVAFAKKIQPKLACGVTINYNQFRSQNQYYQNHQIITFNAGLSYKINPKTLIGFQIENPNRSQIIVFPKENLPATIRLGMKHKLSHYISAYIDALQSSNQNLNVSVGIEIIKEQYKIRMGVNLNQIIGCGFSFKKGNILIDVGLRFHNHLGISPSLNTSYAL